jgi:hypothetical protein
MVLNARVDKKVVTRGIENGSQCPRRQKNRHKGNRESVSMPETVKNQAQRESRERLDARDGRKSGMKGTESVSQFPSRQKNR